MIDEKPFNMQVGQRLRHARILRGWSQSDIGEKMGVSFQQVQKYENGKNGLSAEKLLVLAVLLDKPVTYFYNASESTTELLARRNMLHIVQQLQVLEHRRPGVFSEISRLLAVLVHSPKSE